MYSQIAIGNICISQQINLLKKLIYFILNIIMQPRTCAKCSSIPEDILLLVCNHHLCVNCAAFKLAFQQKELVCEFCNKQTILDSESIFELNKLRVVLEDRINKSNIKDLKNGQLPENPEKESPPVVLKKMCRLHLIHQVIYYCFDCECECICPECIIHGVHRDHNVQTLKKSHPIVKAKLQNELQNITKNIESISKKTNDVDNHLNKLKEQSIKLKKEIQTIFIELKAAIDRKQKQLLQICEQMNGQIITKYQNQSNQLKTMVKDIKIFHSQIIQMAKKDQVTLIDFYSKNRKFLKSSANKINLDNFLKPNTDKQIPFSVLIQFFEKQSSEISKFDFKGICADYQMNPTKLQSSKDSPKKINDNLNTKDNRKKD